MNNPTIFKLNDTITVGGIRLRVRYLHDRRALVVQALEHVHDLLDQRRVEISSRLVGEDDPRVSNNCTSYADELLLAA